MATSEDISSAFPFTKKKVSVLGSQMAYVDVGDSSPSGQTVVFLHGNPTSSYLWRNIIPLVSPVARCIAPDLVGMGSSDKVPSLDYRFEDHYRYLSAFFDTILPESSHPHNIILVVHDWGSALGLHWACTHPSRIAGLGLMEFLGPIPSWDVFPPDARATFQGFRNQDGTGRKMIIEQNMFIEGFVPFGVVRTLPDAVMNAYRAPFLDPADREPLFRWPNEIPIANHPVDVAAIVEEYHAWLMRSEVPKLLFWAEPGAIVDVEKAKWYEANLKNCKSVGIGKGKHYIQEDNPRVIGEEIAKWMPGLGKGGNGKNESK